MRGRTFGGRRTPTPPTNPPEPKYTHSDHDTGVEPILDFDGPSVSEEEKTDSPIAVVVRERYTCRRDGCDASGGHNHLYTLDGLSERLMQCITYAVKDASWNTSEVTWGESIIEYVAMNARVIDYDEKPVLTIDFNGDTLGYIYPEESVEKGHIGGECHGRVDEATRLGI